ncbi:MAG: flagellar basal body rod protein FlgB [Gammaproteobacteria bacterium]|nr:flagellar basal body rod protein FlgB [Gammaproteobacteria bacterium]MBL6998430.1 flagellar basal body rod protein FlgB [Gammaproteobacteria bacterium]
MSIIERAFSIHDDALQLRSRRSSILAANIANADTPNYKARDMDFTAMMQNLESKQQSQLTLSGTHHSHITTAEPSDNPTIKFRNPLHASLDGNTVDMHVEQARFSENAIQYQTSLTFLNSKIAGLKLAIRGQ